MTWSLQPQCSLVLSNTVSVCYDGVLLTGRDLLLSLHLRMTLAVSLTLGAACAIGHRRHGSDTCSCNVAKTSAKYRHVAGEMVLLSLGVLLIRNARRIDLRLNT
jgi:hypothetical protein